MRLQFDADQDYQLRAIESTVRLFEGQPPVQLDFDKFFGTDFAAIGNSMSLDESRLLENVRAVQKDNGLTPDDSLFWLGATVDTATGPQNLRFPNFSIEMETGTGKTYVYLRTALELFRHYGQRKYIIVVPSVAIREGVLKTLRITEPHFHRLYGKLPYRFYAYNSDTLTQIRQFTLSQDVELMVMTIDSFNKASNIIRQPTDRLQGETPIHLLQAVRPILILDEPQNMETELSIQALAALNPLMALRYSATHRNPYNLIYRLTPIEAYQKGLVKKIEVASVLKERDASRPYLRLDAIASTSNSVTARIAVHRRMADGTIRETAVNVRPGTSLEQKANRSEYRGFDVDEINAACGFVRFANNTEIKLGEALGADKQAIFEAQIRYTIEEHFRKQARLRRAGIKVLSLFFIDKVDNYARNDGLIRVLFNRLFDELKQGYPDWRDKRAEDVQAAYFAQRRRRSGEIEFIDSVSGKAKEDEAVYDLIMRDKERLLSFDEPVAFIFSHSALREGWDNPNVFQICTLNQSVSEIKKRQEIGRGIRLCVDQNGTRVHDERMNVLTVIANESYEEYVTKLQSEYAEAYGSDSVPPKPADARQRGSARLRQEMITLKEFRDLWERIKHKTRYTVSIDSEALIREVVQKLNEVQVLPPRVVVTKAQVQVTGQGQLRALQVTGTHPAIELAGPTALPNIVDLMQELMERTTPAVKLTRRTLFEIFRRCNRKAEALRNPPEFARLAVSITKEKLAGYLVRGIQYRRTGQYYEMTQLDQEIESWSDLLVKASRSVYDHVPCDSEVEKQFVRDLESRSDVKVYIKLPPWFTVPTPVGPYNPDWAIALEVRDPHGDATDGSCLYLVRETKASNRQGDLRPDEYSKIQCAERHFRDALGVDYKVATSGTELP